MKDKADNCINPSSCIFVVSHDNGEIEYYFEKNEPDDDSVSKTIDNIIRTYFTPNYLDSEESEYSNDWEEVMDGLIESYGPEISDLTHLRCSLNLEGINPTDTGFFGDMPTEIAYSKDGGKSWLEMPELL